MITFGLGTLMLLTYGLGNALRIGYTKPILDLTVPHEVEFIDTSPEITFVNLEVEK